jgi:hypothetical protein
VAAAGPGLRADRGDADPPGRAGRQGEAGGDLRRRRVEIVDEPVIDLRELRHPLLALRAAQEKRTVTPNDLALGQVPDRSTAKVLVVSAPTPAARPCSSSRSGWRRCSPGRGCRSRRRAAAGMHAGDLAN